jgi:hypothetical protein
MDETHAPTIPEHHRVLIAAAVAAVCGPGARVLKAVPAGDEAGSWARLGRMAIHYSHSLPGRDGLARFGPKHDRGR